MLYYALILLLPALIVGVLLFRVVAFASAEIARVFLVLFLVLSPVNAFCYFARRKTR